MKVLRPRPHWVEANQRRRRVPARKFHRSRVLVSFDGTCSTVSPCRIAHGSGGSSLSYFPYRHELTGARRAVSRGRRVTDTDAGPVEYADNGHGFPFLSVHGAGGGYDQGLANVSDFVGHDFRIIAPSRFGYLGAPIPLDTSPAAQADAHFALLNRLDIGKAVVMGVSAGARSALELAIRHPECVSALILMVPGTYSPTSPVSIESSRGSQFTFWLVNHGADFIWWAMEKVAPSVLIRFVGVLPELVFASSKTEQTRVMDIVRSIEPLSLRFAGINIDSTPKLSPLPLDKVTAPTLIISARDDLFNTMPAAEFAAAKIPRAKLVVYDTGGHLMVGRQQQVGAVIRNFLSDPRLIPGSPIPGPSTVHGA